MKKEHLDLVLKTLPEEPGVYNYFDSSGKILYVGKAKNLKRRVSSYFNREQENGKTRVMVSKIADIKYVVVPSEADALLLENTLIKELKPRYNIMLKDDKTYPWICLTDEDFPRLFLTRRRPDGCAQYFGPFTNVNAARSLLELAAELAPFRSCRIPITQKTVESGRQKPCLEYHIKRCYGPCAGLQGREDYRRNMDLAVSIIKGRYGEVISELRSLMKKLSAELRFEEAHLVKARLDSIEKYQAKVTVVGDAVLDADVFSIVSDAETAYVNYLKVEDGAIVRSFTLELDKKLDESDEELLSLAIVELRKRFDSGTKEIFIPFEVDFDFGPKVKISVPKIGDKHRLMELSRKQAVTAKLERLKQEKIKDPDKHTKRLMQQMQKDLQMGMEPRYIECFDNSNIQGTNAVSSCVVFRDGRPCKKDYRIFNVKTVEGANDFATMAEVMQRRYSRLLQEGAPLPDLIVVDGGKGQLSSAYEILKNLGIEGSVKIIGLAKRLEEIYFPGDPNPLWLSKRSETLRVIQQLRDEAHRFGISHHRKKRSKAAFTTELTEIDGIGQKTAESLLREFGSVKKISEASVDELSAVIGGSKARLVEAWFAGKRTV